MRTSSIWKYQLFLLIAVVSFVFLSHAWGPIPALGPLLSPFQGVWRNLPRQLSADTESLAVPGLKEKVEVVWDNYGVPHIFAKRAEDLYRAQGYIVARDRLFQMDVSSRPGGGQLSELAGESTRKFDRFFIKIGLRRSSERALEVMLNDPQTRLALENYTAGVNAYIESLSENEYPPEYKILGSQPSLWTPLRTAHFLKTMAFNLAARSFDLYLTQHLQKFGREKTEFLFPHTLTGEDYIFQTENLKFSSLRPSVPSAFETFLSEIRRLPDFFQPNKNQGSNNFAVTAKKSATGYPLLANDTHLGLSLPAVWYELQLKDLHHNVYGATFPGSPGVILGFTPELAWGVTNGTTDVLDWYELEFKSKDSLEYLVDGKWKSAERQVELLKVKGGGTEEVEVLWTDFGVVILRQSVTVKVPGEGVPGENASGQEKVKHLGWALKWTAHEASNELKAFLQLNHSHSYGDCENAISYFKTPSQNFICADKNHVGLKHQGRFPQRFQGQGKYIMDGRRSENNWSGWIDEESLPGVKDPEVGYVRSSNNMVLDNRYPYYLGWDYDESYRAKRIRSLLEEKTKLSPEDLMAIQNDVIDLHAKSVVPHLVRQLSRKNLSQEQLQAIEKLEAWDFFARAEGVETTVYKIWWNSFEELLFDEMGEERYETYYPRRQKTAQIFDRPIDERWKEWIDVQSTDEVETLDVLVNQSFKLAWKKIEKERGAFGKAWAWGKARPTDFLHVARIPGFGATDLEVSGTRYSPRASTGDLGPTWKLVVSLGPELKAWTHIPGHNQGHPFSSYFDFYMQDWIEGKMKPVHFLDSPVTNINEKRLSVLHPTELEREI